MRPLILMACLKTAVPSIIAGAVAVLLTPVPWVIPANLDADRPPNVREDPGAVPPDLRPEHDIETRLRLPNLVASRHSTGEELWSVPR